MVTQVYEGIRFQVAGKTVVNVPFVETHETIPIVTACLEGPSTVNPQQVAVTVTGISQTDATVRFSTVFFMENWCF